MSGSKIWYFKFKNNLKIVKLNYFNIKNISINKNFYKQIFLY